MLKLALATTLIISPSVNCNSMCAESYPIELSEWSRQSLRGQNFLRLHKVTTENVLGKRNVPCKNQ